MTLQAGNNQSQSTWVNPPVVPLTNSVVCTPLSKRPLVTLDGIAVDGHIINETNRSATPTLDTDFDPVAVPTLSPMKSTSEGALAAVIQIWEGVVLSVDFDNDSMTVKLTDRGGLIEEHSADIELQWVHEQDRDLLRPGAVFYWTLYKETKRGTISNSQEIRFRRLPSWSRSQLAVVQQEANKLSGKFSLSNRLAD